jgi:hypothetical protein
MDTHMNAVPAGLGVGPMTATGGDRASAVPSPAALAAPGPNAPAHWVPAYVAAHSKMRESADIAKIAPALVRAQGAMENPPRNRSVQVRTQAGSYTFRYATLDKITDMTRHALAEAGLCVLQPIVGTERGPALVTRLLHESGQWMECEVLLPALGSNPQAFGSAVTYVRRYSICALLNIAADEDDDANRAAGNHYADVAATPRRDRGRASSREEAAPVAAPGSAEDAARALVNRARVAESVEDGHALLDAWQRDATRLEMLRGGKGWEALERELGAGLKRSLGVDPAAAFVAALRAADPQQVAALQQHWEGKWSDTLSAMQQEAPATYALLRRHVATQIARVRAASPGDEQGSRRGDTAAPAFAAHLRDETGEVASDPIGDALAFAGAYADLWHATDADARTALAWHNAKALGQAVQDAGAREVLNALDRDGQARSPAGLPAPAQQPRPDASSAKRAAPRPPRKDEARPASIWAIVRPDKDAITAPDGPAWLKWWRDTAAKAAAEGKEDALRALSEANAPTWDRIAGHAPETEAEVAEVARAVKTVIEA